MSEIEPYETPSRAMSKWLAPTLFLIVGVGFGIGIMTVLNKPATRPMSYAELDPTRQIQDSRFNEDGSPKLNEDLEGESAAESGSVPVLPSDTFAKGANAGSGSSGVPAPIVPPTDPNGQAPPIGAPPALSGSLSGSLMPDGQMPLKPIVIEPDKAVKVELAYTEFASPVTEESVEPMTQQVRRTASAAGGRVHFEFVWDTDRPELGREVIATVPIAQAEKLRSELAKISALSEADRWTGAAGDRHFRMERFLRDAADRVETRLSQLRLRFHDDAPDVVRAAETLDRLQKAMTALKPVGADREVIRISIGKRAG